MDLDFLFRPLKLNEKLTIRNRFVMAPMTRCFSPNGIPTDDAIDYYARRARGGVGLIITEGIGIAHPSTFGSPNVPVLHTDEAKRMWSKVVKKVHESDGKIFCQLWHVGGHRAVDFDLTNQVPSLAPSAICPPGLKLLRPNHIPSELTHAQIYELIEAYQTSAKAAVEAGFDGLEIHGAHGYLIDQFFWKKTNLRSDEFGIHHRTKFAEMVIKAIKEITPKKFVVGFRFSQWKLITYDEHLANDPVELKALLDPLSKAGVDVFHASTYRFYSPAFNNSKKTLAGYTREITGKPTIAIGGVGMSADYREEKKGMVPGKDFQLKELLQTKNEFDMIALGRALISEPDWVHKFQNEKFDNIKPYSKEDLKTLF